MGNTGCASFGWCCTCVSVQWSDIHWRGCVQLNRCISLVSVLALVSAGALDPACAQRSDMVGNLLLGKPGCGCMFWLVQGSTHMFVFGTLCCIFTILLSEQAGKCLHGVRPEPSMLG